jgi:hypothetical protein
VTRGWVTFATVAASAGLLLTACDTKNYVAGIDRSGTPSAVVTRGPITAFGSIFVNGVEYETSNAAITFKEAPSTENDLAIGHIVTVRGTGNGDGTGSADEIEFETNVQGPVDSINIGANTLIIMGQAVELDGLTSFGGFTPADINGVDMGEIVEVSGFVGANGVIRATRVAALPASSELEVIGTIANLDGVAQTYEIGTLSVDYSTASVDGFSGAGPAEGDSVETEGSTLSNGVLIAQQVEFRAEGLGGNDGEEGEVEGLISRFVDPTDFGVDGVACTTNSSTDYEGGTEADLQPNVKIQVEGTFDSAGILVASKIEVKDGGAVQLNAKVQIVDSANAALVVGDRRISILPNTRLEDLSAAEERYFSPSRLRVGDQVDVTGKLVGDEIVATSLVRTEAK